MTGSGWSILAGARRLSLGDGRSLRLLSALEVLEARREAAALSSEDRERALCGNACLLARALEKRGKPVFSDGRDVLEHLTVEEIEGLARRWSEFRRREDPSPEDGEKVDALKKAWSTRLMSAFSGACSGPLGRFLPSRGPRK